MSDKDLPKTVEQSIEEVLSNFDFDKVQRVMQFLKWSWFDVGIPNHYHLVKEAETLLKRVYTMASASEESAYSSTGGFTAACKKVDGVMLFKLYFSIDEYETDS